MDKIFKQYLYLLLFSPLIAYFLMKGFQFSRYYGIDFYLPVTTVLGIIFLLNKNGFKFPKYLIPLLLYIFYMLLWNVINGNIERRGLIIYLFHRNAILATFFILLIIENLKYSEKFIRKSIKVIKITIIAAFIVTLIQIFFDPFFFTPIKSISLKFEHSLYKIRRGSIFGYLDPNAIGLAFLPLLSVLTGYYTINNIKRYTIWLGMAGIVSIATNGRYVIIAYLLVLSQLLFMKTDLFFSKTIRRIFTLSLILVMVIFSFSYFGYTYNEFYSQRIFPEQKIENTTRYLAYLMFLKYFPDNYLFGTGVHLSKEIKRDLAGRSSQIHVGYLSHLVSYGIVGSLLLFSFWFLLAKRLYRVAKKTKYYGSFFAFLVFLWANVTLVYYSVFTYGLVFAFIFSKYYSDKLENYQVESKKVTLNKNESLSPANII